MENERLNRTRVPYVHEGAAARNIERKGGVSYLCQENRMRLVENEALEWISVLEHVHGDFISQNQAERSDLMPKELDELDNIIDKGFGILIDDLTRFAAKMAAAREERTMNPKRSWKVGLETERLFGYQFDTEEKRQALYEVLTKTNVSPYSPNLSFADIILGEMYQILDEGGQSDD